MFFHLDRVFLAPIGLVVILPCLAPAVETPVPCAMEIQLEAGGRISDFAETGSTPEVVRKLVRSMSMNGRILRVFGFENVEGPVGKVFLAANDEDVATLVHKLCQQDPRLRLMETGNPHLVNLLAADASAPGRAILNFHLSKFDIETDASPEDLVATLPTFSKELDEYLSRVFAAGGGSPGGGAVITGIGDAKRPHFSIHLKNVTVRDVLNTIAAESYRLYVANRRDRRTVSDRHEL